MQVGVDLQPVVVLHQPGSLDWVGGPSQLPRVWVNSEETGPLFGVASSSGAFAMLATELNCVGMPEGPPSYGPKNKFEIIIEGHVCALTFKESRGIFVQNLWRLP